MTIRFVNSGACVASVRWYRVSSKRLQTIAAVSYEFGLVFG